MAKSNYYHRVPTKQSAQFECHEEGPLAERVTVRCRAEDQGAIRDVARALKDYWVSRGDVDAFLQCGGPGYFAPVRLSSVETYSKVVDAADSMGKPLDDVWEEALAMWLSASEGRGAAGRLFEQSISGRIDGLERAVSDIQRRVFGAAAALAKAEGRSNG